VLGLLLPVASASLGPERTPEAAAAAFLESNPGGLHLRSVNDLRLNGVVASLTGYHVTYQQTLDGIPVFGAMVNVFVDWTMTPRLAISSLSDLRPDATAPAVDAKAASALLGLAGVSASAPSLVLYPDGDTARLAWRVDVADPVAGDWTVFSSAVDGRTVAVLDARKQVTGTGLVFDPNPIATSGNSRLRDEEDANYPELAAEERQVTLEALDGDGVLRGQYAVVRAGKGPDAREETEAYAYTRDDTRFEQVMAYYHIDHTMRYVASLGFADIVSTPQEVKVDQFAYDNSYYNTANKRISLGRGGVDDAEDADVIVHEFGHAIQDRQVPGFGIGHDAGSMGEGFGDYLAVTMHYDHVKRDWRPLVAMWDATSYDDHDPAYLRRVDLNLRYPQDQTGYIHHDGQIWSRLLWDIREFEGAEVADTIILEAHTFLTPTASFQDGAEALFAADYALYGGAHIWDIAGFLSDRGLPYLFF